MSQEGLYWIGDFFVHALLHLQNKKNIKRSYNGNWQVSVQRITNRGSFFNLEGDEVIMEEYLEKKKSKSFVECNSIEEKKELESKKKERTRILCRMQFH